MSYISLFFRIWNTKAKNAFLQIKVIFPLILKSLKIKDRESLNPSTFYSQYHSITIASFSYNSLSSSTKWFLTAAVHFMQSMHVARHRVRSTVNHGTCIGTWHWPLKWSLYTPSWHAFPSFSSTITVYVKSQSQSSMAGVQGSYAWEKLDLTFFLVYSV